MKNLVLFSLFCLCSCNHNTTQPIIDYNNAKNPIIDYNKDSYDNINFTSALKKKQNEQTVVLINSKVYSYNDFNLLIEKNKIKTFKVIKDKEDIEKMNYSYDKIKTIILAELN